MNDVTIHFDSATRVLTINGMSCQLADDTMLLQSRHPQILLRSP
jgi:hypothetical protein